MASQKSAPMSLNKTDWPVIGLAFLVGLGLSVAEYITQFATNTDFGELTPIVSATIPPLLAFVIRYVRNNQK